MARGFHHAPGADAEALEAQNPALTKAALLPLGSSRSVAVRAIVASRLDCPLGLMVTLAHDYHVDVRCAIATNTSAQRSVLAYLAADRQVEVVKALLGNPSLPTEILDELSFHKKAVVREAAARRLNDSTARGRDEARASEMFDDARVPEVAEHVASASASVAWHGTGEREWTEVNPAIAGTSDVQNTPEADPHAHAAGEPSVFVPSAVQNQESTPRWTRTAPVRGFRPPREQGA